MVGCSLTQRGEELLGQRGGLAAYRERGSTFGIPLLHPWANRLAGTSYSAGRAPGGAESAAIADPPRLERPADPRRPGRLADWEVVGRTPGNGSAAVAARLDFGAHEQLMAAFPFPHELHVQAELRRRHADGRDDLAADRGRRGAGLVRMAPLPAPARGAALGVAGGAARARGARCWTIAGCRPERPRPVEIEPGPLGDRTYDDHFVALDRPAVFALEGGGRRIEVELGQGYPFAQVFAPAGVGEEPYVCFEPMTAPVNALVSGDGLRSVPPGGSFRAEFSVRVQALSGAQAATSSRKWSGSSPSLTSLIVPATGTSSPWACT